jgi:prepilin-type N-terminal cleavage/methylation domain-containing protein
MNFPRRVFEVLKLVLAGRVADCKSSSGGNYMNVSRLENTNSKRAFTLIELLVVIAIIAILAAILFPVFAQAKLAAKKTVGLSDCKQIALADVMYEGDYDDFVVPGLVNADPGSLEASYEENPGAADGDNAYDHLLMPYIKSQGLWVDPGGQTLALSATIPAYKNITMSSDAAVDLSGWADWTNTPISATGVAYPSDFILQANGQAQPFNHNSNFAGVMDSAVSACFAWENQAAGLAMTSYDEPYRLYNETANYSMSDGHAKAMHVGQTLFPNVMWFKEFPTAASMAAAPQGAGWYPAVPAAPISNTMNCDTFQLWDGDGGF